MFWSVGVVILGWMFVLIAARSGVMRPTWPENEPSSARQSNAHQYEQLSPLLYSLDVFLPFVNLHQEHYWWPDANVSGAFVVLNHTVYSNGRALRTYLWLQIIAGWVLSAIFIAGVTGLIRND